MVDCSYSLGDFPDWKSSVRDMRGTNVSGKDLDEKLRPDDEVSPRQLNAELAAHFVADSCRVHA